MGANRGTVLAPSPTLPRADYAHGREPDMFEKEHP